MQQPPQDGLPFGSALGHGCSGIVARTATLSIVEALKMSAPHCLQRILSLC